MENYMLHVVFDDNRAVRYDLKDDIRAIPDFQALESVYGLFQQAQMDASRTCIYWNERIDLPSDTIYEYGKDDK